MDPTDTDTPPVPAKPRSSYTFRRNRVPLPRDEAQRQGDISQLAFLTMGGRDPAVAFLNADNPELGGRPLALATASAEGFARVADAIRARAANDP
ncbi:antitoxin Xre/MbcA/ParS toxin-binding domain-containing protein [Sphingopyxis sp.]|uniref:antitoxin Xre/MbcA/ParS toxin-binding domain-containing protein n=1 Tax=Sphingopyxis sp. TaxID=1908224 RepID=UPI003BAB1B45